MLDLIRDQTLEIKVWVLSALKEKIIPIPRQRLRELYLKFPADLHQRLNVVREKENSRTKY